MGLSRSAKYYRDNPEARAKKNAYQKQFNKKKSQSKNRADLNRLNRLFGTYGNGDNLDVSHRTGKKTRLEHQSKNRGSKTNTAGDRRARGNKKN
jgi:hypothetical protein